MSLRYLRFETEHENGMVDERGVLIPGASGATIVEIDEQYNVNAALYDKLFEMVQNGQPICFYYENKYYYPVCVSSFTNAGTTEDTFSFAYGLSFVLIKSNSAGTVERERIEIVKYV